jgi:hypothetical protein
MSPYLVQIFKDLIELYAYDPHTNKHTLVKSFTLKEYRDFVYAYVQECSMDIQDMVISMSILTQGIRESDRISEPKLDTNIVDFIKRLGVDI